MRDYTGFLLKNNLIGSSSLRAFCKGVFAKLPGL
jgi:hypothetical protein